MFRVIFNKIILKILGVKIGKNVVIKGRIDILLRDDAKYSNIAIGDNFKTEGDLIIRNRKNGKIIIKNNVSVGKDVWIVCANDSELKIENNVIIGSYSILNGGHGIIIGKNSWLAGFVYINSSDHQTKKDVLIQKQGYIGKRIIIGEDCWIGGHTFINKGVCIGNGSVVGAGSVVTKSFGNYVIVVGNPAKYLKDRV
jgi:acetyltransferase-like isoleucine patch superfamily enzyme